jgi:carbon monoxide dehydrogenase subunit G
MELDNSFTVPVPPDVAWGLLLDVARIAPCMPGATVDEVDGDVVNGRIKVKVGPVSLTYKGTATFTQRDEATRTVSLEASGKETRGAGTASAVVTAALAPAEADSTLVTMHTTMNVTGRPAQFGRGVMLEVGGKLVEKFAENLALQLTAGSSGAAGSAGAAGVTEASAGDEAGVMNDVSAANGSIPAAEPATATPAAAAPTPAASAPTPASAPAQEDSLNLVRLVAPAILKRAIPVAAIVAGLALLGRRLRRGFRRSKQ